MAHADRNLIAGVLREMAALLELQGENPFKIRAYENAARAVEGMADEPEERVAAGTLSEVRGIGDAMVEKIEELVRSGELKLHRELRASFPPGVLDLFRVSGLGPQKIRLLIGALAIQSPEELEAACREGRVAALPGFGVKSQENLLRGLADLRRFRGRHLLSEALAAGLSLLAHLRSHRAVARAELAGSLRRWCETVGDLDLVAAVPADQRQTVAAHFEGAPQVERVLASGETKVSLLLQGGMQADLRMVEEDEFASALHHFTGSKAHNIEIRSRARARGITVNEYGLSCGSERLPIASEEDLYARLDLAFIPPELREGLGEIKRAEEGPLPRLVEWEDLKGTFHVHTTWSDGIATVEEMAGAARALGWEYLGIADHSQVAAYAGGLSPERVREQWNEIDRLNERWRDFKLFKGTECDILPDGRLDFLEELLAGFDYVVVSVHSRFNQAPDQMTARLVRALSQPHVTFLGHPTGRLLLARDGYSFDFEPVLAAAAEHGVVVEINANPHRLDLDWRHLPGWLARGLPTSIHPDAHSAQGLSDVRFGVGVARKGGARKEDVLNTRSLREIERYFGDRRAG